MEELQQISSETELKLCINCSHFRGMRSVYDSTSGGGTAECFKTRDLGTVSPVDGRRPATFFTCLATRNDVNKCGMDAKWYEEYKQPERSFILPPTPKKDKKITADDL